MVQSRKKYNKVLGKLDNFFKVRKNVLYKCVRFNKKSQQEEEMPITRAMATASEGNAAPEALAPPAAVSQRTLHAMWEERCP